MKKTYKDYSLLSFAPAVSGWFVVYCCVDNTICQCPVVAFGNYRIKERKFAWADVTYATLLKGEVVSVSESIEPITYEGDSGGSIDAHHLNTQGYMGCRPPWVTLEEFLIGRERDGMTLRMYSENGEYVGDFGDYGDEDEGE